MPLDQIDSIHIAAPCPTSWEGMDGDSRVRHCTLCDLNVYNISELTRDEARALIARTEGRLCVRLYRRADGSVITRDCPTGLRSLRRRARRVVVAAITTILSVPSLGFAGWFCRKPRSSPDGFKGRVSVETVAATQRPKVKGVILLQGNPFPGVRITVRNEASTSEETVLTDVNGMFAVPDLSEGVYRVEAEMESCHTARIEHLKLTTGQVANARIEMQLSGTYQDIMVGAVALPLDEPPHATTYTHQFLDNLPH